MVEIGKDINKAIKLLEAGELVGIPTETVYGLAGDALNAGAVTKIFVAKSRPHFDPLIVHVSSLQRAEQFVQAIPEKALILSKLFWPGPLTLLMKKKQNIPDLVTAGLDTVGIRCPRHPLALELLKKLKFPLAAPSANPFGYVSPTRAGHVREQLGDKISYVLDGGPCLVGIESTIVGFEDHQTILYRFGGLSIENIEGAIGKVTLQSHSTANPKAPGQLKTHYAPQKRLVLGNILALFNTYGRIHVGTLSFSTLFQDVEKRNQIILSPSGNTGHGDRGQYPPWHAPVAQAVGPGIGRTARRRFPVKSHHTG